MTATDPTPYHQRKAMEHANRATTSASAEVRANELALAQIHATLAVADATERLFRATAYAAEGKVEK